MQGDPVIVAEPEVVTVTVPEGLVGLLLVSTTFTSQPVFPPTAMGDRVQLTWVTVELRLVMVTLIVVGVVVAPRGEAVTWKLYEPGATEVATLIVRTLVAPEIVGVTGLTVKLPQVTPVGRLGQDNVTG